MATNSSTGNWIAIIGLVLAVPGALLAWTQLNDSDDDSPPAVTTTESPTIKAPTTAGGTNDTEVLPKRTDESPAGGEFDVSDCVITVDHIGAQIRAEPSHDARVLDSVPSGDYSPLAATEATWAGLVELWYQLDVGGRVGWLADSAIIVTSRSSGCP